MSTFGNLSGFGLTPEQHAAAMGVEMDKLAAVFRALDKTLARGVPACAKSLALVGQAQMLYGMAVAHGYSMALTHGHSMAVANAYKARMAELVPKTIAACARRK